MMRLITHWSTRALAHRPVRPASVITFALLALTLARGAKSEDRPDAIDFNRDIRPILSENCYQCHGLDKKERKADLRLDDRDSAVELKTIVPGNPEESELVARIFSEEPDEVMPPPKSRKSLTLDQRQKLKQWIAEGAVYKGHWAYEVPVRPKAPAGPQGIDTLIEQRLSKLGLTPSPEADRRTLIRRLYFDLIGLPSTPQEVDTFLNDKSPDSYENLVDRLLASRITASEWRSTGSMWSASADTIGYHSDTPRNVWPYRDYVIRSFNQNTPSTASPSSNWPATSCLIPPRSRRSPRVSTGCS